MNLPSRLPAPAVASLPSQPARRSNARAAAWWVALTTLLGASSVHATVIRYEAASGTLPNQHCPAWNPFINGGPATPSIVSGCLRIATTANAQELAFGHSAAELSIPSALVVEFRTRWISGTAPHPALTGTGIIIAVGGSKGIHFSIDNGSIYLSKIGSSGALERGAIAIVNTSDAPHTYRVEVVGTAVSVYHDGVLKLTSSLQNSTPFFGTTPQIYWGDITSSGSGTADWEYFEHNAYVEPAVPGFAIETHALVSGAAALTLSPGGTLFAGRDVPGEQTQIYRVGPCRTPSGLFGPVLPDPDAVAFDAPGLLGSSGSVLVGSQLVGTGTGRIDAVRNDGSFTTVAGPSALLLNPSDMAFDATGRLIVALEDGRVVACSGGTVSLLYTLVGVQLTSVAVAPDGSILTVSSAPGPTVRIHRHAADGTVIASPFLSGLAAGAPVAAGPGDSDWGSDLYTVRADGALLRVALDGTSSVVGTGFAGRANEFEFGPDGALYVSAFGSCRILRIARLPLAETPPTVTAPIAVEAPADAGACGRSLSGLALGTATVNDACGSVVVSHDAPAFFPVGVTLVTWTGVDSDGNTSTATQLVTIIDGTPPSVTIPADITATTGPGTELCADAVVVVAVGEATATDACGTPTVTVSGLPEGSRFPVGETVLTWVATDAAGNVVTGTQRVVVSCPVGVVTGTAVLSCSGGSTPAAGVTILMLHEGAPFRTTATGSDGSYRFEDARLGTYTVSITAPEGYAVAPSTQLVTLGEAGATAEPFAFTCLLADLGGQVVGTCNGATVPLHGVTVDLYREDDEGLDVLVATTASGESGGYSFPDQPLGDYTVGIVLPLGYTTSSASQTVALVTPDGSLTADPFGLVCQAIAAAPRSMGYWKHQVNVYLTGKGQAHETLVDLLRYLDAMVAHFNENLVNPVVVYVPGATTTNDKLLQLQQLLTVNRGGTMLDRARQQLLALLLNVVSGKIGQTEAISDNGATVSQAITHSHDLIVDGNPATDETAKTICDLINNGQRVPAGMVPTSTRAIVYRHDPAPREGLALALRLGPIAPNPATAEAVITFALPDEAPARLDVHDLAGRLVARRELGGRGAGVHTLRLAELGALRPGVYLVRLTHGREALTRRLAVTR